MTEDSSLIRTLSGQPTQLLLGYNAIEMHDSELRQVSCERHVHVVTLWLNALALFADAFAPGRVFNSNADEDDSVTRKAYALRLQLLGLSGRNSKPALDLIVAGYYTEAFALIRGMLEGWARTLYIRLRPHEYHRWYESETELAEGQLRKKEPSFGEVDGVIAADGDTEDRAFFDEANLRFRLLSMGTHPSGHGITQIHDYERGVMLFNPVYREDLCLHAFYHGLFAQRVLLDEVVSLGPQSEDWLELLGHFLRLCEPIHLSIQPVLEEEAKILEEERAAKRAARAAAKICVANKSAITVTNPSNGPFSETEGKEI